MGLTEEIYNQPNACEAKKRAKQVVTEASWDEEKLEAMRAIIEILCKYIICCANSLDSLNITNRIACYWFVYVILTSFKWNSLSCPNSLTRAKSKCVQEY